MAWVEGAVASNLGYAGIMAGRKNRTKGYDLNEKAVLGLDSASLSSGETKRALLYILEDYNEIFNVLEKAKGEWEATFDAIATPIFIHDRKLKITRANTACRTEAGLSFLELIGRPYPRVFPWMGESVKDCRESSLNGCEGMCEITRRDNGRVYSVRFYPVKMGADSNHCLHIVDDVTKERRAQRKLKEEIEATTNLLSVAEATANIRDIDVFMDRIIRSVKNIIKCDVCVAYLWNARLKEFTPAAHNGLGSDKVPFFRMTRLKPAGLEFVTQVFKAGVPQVLNGEGVLPRDFLKLDRVIRSVVAMPFRSNEGYLGLILGLHTDELRFKQREVALLKGIHHQISIALEEARLFRQSIEKTIELSNRVEMISVMHEIDKTLLSTLNRADMLGTTACMIERILHAENVSVCIVDRERSGFIFAAGAREYVEDDALVEFERTSATEVYANGRPQYLPNMQNIKELLPFEALLLSRGYLSVMRVPLMIKGEVNGVLSAASRHPSAFTPADLSLFEGLSRQISVALENTKLVEDLEELFMSTIRVLSGAIDAKSPWTAGHSARVTHCAIKIGEAMGLKEEELKNLRLAGILHDIGKIGVSEEILDKPMKLSPEEVAVMRSHPVKSDQILRPIRQLKDVLPAIRHHHEHYDGAGYPDGLSGEEIPYMARILAVADTVDAMASDRPYRAGMPMDVIISELRRCSVSQFDADVVDASVKVKKDLTDIYRRYRSNKSLA